VLLDVRNKEEQHVRPNCCRK